MKTLLSAIASENKKLIRLYVLWGTLALYLLVCAIRAGEADWNTYLGNVVFMFSSVLGLVGFAVLTGWAFGREYADRTLKDLLALPVSRGKVVAAKVTSCLGWCLILAQISFLFPLFIGLIVGIPNFSKTLAPALFHSVTDCYCDKFTVMQTRCVLGQLIAGVSGADHVCIRDVDGRLNCWINPIKSLFALGHTGSSACGKQ